MLERDGEDQLDRSREKRRRIVNGKRKDMHYTLQTIKGRNVDRIGHILLKHCLLKHVTEGKVERRIEMTRRRGRRRRKLLDDLSEKRGYWKLKEEALDRTL